jgi:hypothetical protein
MFNRTLIAAGAGLVILVTASTAPAQDPPPTDPPPVDPPPPTTVAPKITTKPAIAGVFQEGQELTVTAAWTGEPTPTAAWQWQRCNADGESCKKLAGATADRYVLAKADVGKRMRVKLVVTNTAGSKDARSQPTPVVVALPPPAPEPGPSPEPEPSPEPGPSPGSSPSKPRFTSPEPPPPIVVAEPGSPALLRPFPIVRLRGVLTRTGARIDVFSVRVPAKVSVSVRCRGTSCPSRRLGRRAAARRTVRLKPFEKRLRAGTRLTVKVTRAGWIGKWTTIVIRRGAAPRRSDQCAYPDAKRPAPCPG